MAFPNVQPVINKLEPTDKYSKAYKAIQQSGRLRGLPDYETFVNDMQDRGKRKKFYDVLKATNVISNLPDFDAFDEATVPTRKGANFGANAVKSFLRSATTDQLYNLSGLAAGAEASAEKVADRIENNTPLTPNLSSTPTNLNIDGIRAALGDMAKGFEKFIMDKARMGFPKSGRSYEDTPVDERPFMAIGEGIGKTLEQALPTDERLQEHFWSTTLGQGAGSLAFFMAAGMTGGAAGSALAGATSMGGSEFKNAVDAGATLDEALDTQLYNWMIGASEGTAEMILTGGATRLLGGISGLKRVQKIANKAPVAAFVKAVNKKTKGGVGKVLYERAQQGVSGGLLEASQEAIQNTLTNLVAQNKYDEARSLVEGVGEGAAAGGVLGIATGILLGGIKKAKVKQMADEGQVSEQLEQLDDWASEYMSQVDDFMTNPAPNDEGVSMTVPIESAPQAPRTTEDIANEINETQDEQQKQDLTQQAYETAAEELIPEDAPLEQDPVNEITPEDEAQLQQQAEQEEQQAQIAEDVQDVQQASPFTQDEQEGLLTQKDTGTQYPVSQVERIPYQDIQIDETRFQPRSQSNAVDSKPERHRTDFNEDKVTEIITDYKEHKRERIVTFRDPDSGELFVLSGHHRMEVASRVDQSEGLTPDEIVEQILMPQSFEYKLSNAKNPKVKAELENMMWQQANALAEMTTEQRDVWRFMEHVEMKGTMEQAMSFAATEANATSRQQTLTENGVALRKERRSKALSKNKALQKAESMQRGAGKLLFAISNLNPDGVLMKELREDEQAGTTEGETGKLRAEVARWVGDLRARFDAQLTDLDETQIYRALMEEKKGSYGAYQKFIEEAIDRRSSIADPLDLTGRGAGANEKRVAARYARMQAELDELNNEFEVFEQGVKQKQIESKKSGSDPLFGGAITDEQVERSLANKRESLGITRLEREINGYKDEDGKVVIKGREAAIKEARKMDAEERRSDTAATSSGQLLLGAEPDANGKVRNINYNPAGQLDRALRASGIDPETIQEVKDNANQTDTESARADIESAEALNQPELDASAEGVSEEGVTETQEAAPAPQLNPIEFIVEGNTVEATEINPETKEQTRVSLRIVGSPQVQGGFTTAKIELPSGTQTDMDVRALTGQKTSTIRNGGRKFTDFMVNMDNADVTPDQGQAERLQQDRAKELARQDKERKKAFLTDGFKLVEQQFKGNEAQIATAKGLLRDAYERASASRSSLKEVDVSIGSLTARSGLQVKGDKLSITTTHQKIGEESFRYVIEPSGAYYVEAVNGKIIPSDVKKGYGQNNTLFTKDKLDEVIKKASKGLHSGFSPDALYAGMYAVGYHVEAGLRKFGDIIAAMRQDGTLTEQVIPYLKQSYISITDRWEVADADDMETVDLAYNKLLQEFGVESVGDEEIAEQVSRVKKMSSVADLESLIQQGVASERDANFAPDDYENRIERGQFSSDLIQDEQARQEASAQDRISTGRMVRRLSQDEEIAQRLQDMKAEMYASLTNEIAIAKANEIVDFFFDPRTQASGEGGLLALGKFIRDNFEKTNYAVSVALVESTIIKLQDELRTATDPTYREQVSNELDDMALFFTEKGREMGRGIQIIGKILQTSDPSTIAASFRANLAQRAKEELASMQITDPTTGAVQPAIGQGGVSQQVLDEIKSAASVAIAEREAEIASLMDDLADMKGVNNELLQKAEMVASLNSQLREDLAMANIGKDKAEERVENLEFELNEAQKALKQAKGTLTAEQKKELQQEVKRLKELIKKEQRNAQALSNKVKRLQEQNAEKQKQLKSLRDQIQRMRQDKRQQAAQNKQGIWKQYRGTAVKAIIGQLSDQAPRATPALQVFTNGLISNVKSLLPQGSRTSVRELAVNRVLDIMRNPEKNQQVIDDLRQAVASNTDIDPDVKSEAMAILDTLGGGDVSTKMIRKAMGEAMRPLDLKMKDLLTDTYGLVSENVDAVVQRMVQDAGMTQDEARMMASFVRDTLAEEVDRQQKLAVDRLIKKMHDNVAARDKPKLKNPKRKRRENRMVEDILTLARTGSLDARDIQNLMANYLQITEDPDAVTKLTAMARIIDRYPPSPQKDEAVLRMLRYIENQKGLSGRDTYISLLYAFALSAHETHFLNVSSVGIKLGIDAMIMGVMNPRASFWKAMYRGAVRGVGEGYRMSVRTAKTGMVTGTRMMKQEIDNDALEHLADTYKSPVRYIRKQMAKLNGQSLQEFEGEKYNPLVYAMSAFKLVKRGLMAEDMFMYSVAKELRAEAMAERIAYLEGRSGQEQQERMNELLGHVEPLMQQATEQAMALDLDPNSSDGKVFITSWLEKNRNPDLREDAIEFGRRETFNDNPKGITGLFVRGISQVMEGMKRESSAAELYMRSKIPFLGVVSRVTAEALSYMPFFGLFRAHMVARRYRKNWIGAKRDKVEDYVITMSVDRNGKPVEVFTDEPAIVLTKALAGTFAMIGVLTKMAAGEDDEDPAPRIRVHGGGHHDYTKSLQMRQSGWTPYSIEFIDKATGNSTYVSYREMPFGMALAAIGALEDYDRYSGQADKGEILKRAAVALKASMFLPLQMGFLSGAQEFIESAGRVTSGDLSEGFSEALKAAANYHQPAAMRSLMRMYDPTIYSRQNIEEIAAAMIPSAIDVDGRRPVLNALGEPVSLHRDGVERVLPRFLSKTKGDPVWRLITEKKVYFSTPRVTQKLFYDPATNEYKQATDNQYYNWTYYRGKIFKQTIAQMVPTLQTLPQDQVQKIINDVNRKASDYATAMVQIKPADQEKVIVPIED